MNPKPICILIKSENLEIHTHTCRECHVKMEAEIELMLLLYKPKNAKCCQQNTRSFQRGLEQILSCRCQKEPTLLTLWSWTSSWQNCETRNFCYLSPSICGALLCKLEQHVPAPDVNTHIIHWKVLMPFSLHWVLKCLLWTNATHVTSVSSCCHLWKGHGEWLGRCLSGEALSGMLTPSMHSETPHKWQALYFSQ